MVFANFSAVVPEFKVKFGTLVSSSNLHLTAKYCRVVEQAQYQAAPP